MTKVKIEMQPAVMLSDVEIRRLSWRCRRGLLELDIVLQRFLEHHLTGLNAEELAAFDSLLDYPDNEFFDVVTLRKDPVRKESVRKEFARVEVSKTEFLNAAAMQQVLSKLRSA